MKESSEFLHDLIHNLSANGTNCSHINKEPFNIGVQKQNGSDFDTVTLVSQHQGQIRSLSVIISSSRLSRLRRKGPGEAESCLLLCSYVTTCDSQNSELRLPNTPIYSAMFECHVNGPKQNLFASGN
jgi:hypothetical protein